MRKTSLITGLGLAMMAGAASAVPVNIGNGGFAIDSTRTAGAGALTGFDIVRFIGINRQTAETAGSTQGRLQSISVAMSVGLPQNSPAARLVFDIRDVDGDGENDVNLLGNGLNPTTPVGSYIRVGGAGTFNTALVEPGGYASDTNGDGSPDITPTTNPAFQNTKQFRVDGFNANAPVATGSGVVFAAAVVPTGAQVQISGSLAAEAGSAVPYVYTDPVPEPTALGFIGLGAMGLLSRRRRTA